ncbi:MAG: deoxyguanosinetriphosphate triphosphohydrolase [Clostridia bacterium]|nr:deoxyguanosinetriphosphate triphosphohydrolase [Clostridia bacterium]
MGKSIGEITCELEHKIMCDKAALADSSLGRAVPERESSVRTVYQRDRDRIIHCTSFRRLKHKTQVFLSPEGDHYRTRLTHTLEVSQIARTIARALRLNEDLTEAIALGHDLGHTPFGHAGERALNKLMPGGFHHYLQSERVVDKLEKGGKGLNLTYEVRDGIKCHTVGKPADTFEGRIVKLSDKIAYLNHDIDDAERAGVISEDDIPLEIRQTLGFSKSDRINALVVSAINNFGDDIILDEKTNEAFEQLNTFMFANVYTNPVCKSEEIKVYDMIGRMFSYIIENEEILPAEFEKIRAEEGIETAVKDYIAGMTDRYAISVFEKFFVPKSWYY